MIDSLLIHHQFIISVAYRTTHKLQFRFLQKQICTHERAIKDAQASIGISSQLTLRDRKKTRIPKCVQIR